MLMWPRWKQIFLTVTAVLLFPLSLLVLLVCYVVCVVLATIAGFFIGPCLVADYFQCHTCFSIILCPLSMVLGAIVSLFGSFGYGIYLLLHVLVAYWSIIVDVMRY